MLHKPAPSSEKDPAINYKSGLGIRMFWLYSAFYAGFVVINLVNPILMERTLFWDQSLATIYGLSLIVVALIEALIYDWLCRRQERRLNYNDSEKEA